MAEEIQRPKVGLGIILMNFRTKSVLLGKRKGSHGAGTLSVPGGHLEWFETLQGCAEREMAEETGLHRALLNMNLSENYELLDRYSCAVTNDFFPKEDKHYITLYLRARYLRGKPEVLEPDECEEWKWYKWEKLWQVDLFTPVKNLFGSGYNPFTKI